MVLVSISSCIITSTMPWTVFFLVWSEDSAKYQLMAAEASPTVTVSDTASYIRG
jgi:hypothetical protein